MSLPKPAPQTTNQNTFDVPPQYELVAKFKGDARDYIIYSYGEEAWLMKAELTANATPQEKNGAIMVWPTEHPWCVTHQTNHVFKKRLLRKACSGKARGDNQ